MKEKVSEEQMKKSYGLQRAIAEKRKELNLSALAVRCWPECPEKYGAMACWAMSVLSATGIPCACEGDIYGALTQLIQFGITGINPALLDLVDIERLTNTMVFWHCGAAPYNLAAGKVKGMLHPNRRVGLSLDFELQGAEFTGARLSIGREAHRLLVFYGKKAPMPKHFNGTSLAISVEESVLEKVKIILNTGYEHHYSLVGADIRKELTLFGEMLRLQVQKI